MRGRVVDQFDPLKWASTQHQDFEALAVLTDQFFWDIRESGLLSGLNFFSAYDGKNDNDYNTLKILVKQPYHKMNYIFSFVEMLIPRMDDVPSEARDWLIIMYCLAFLLNRYHDGRDQGEDLDICHGFMQSGENSIFALSTYGFLEETLIGGKWTELGSRLLAQEF